MINCIRVITVTGMLVTSGFMLTACGNDDKGGDHPTPPTPESKTYTISIKAADTQSNDPANNTFNFCNSSFDSNTDACVLFANSTALTPHIKWSSPSASMTLTYTVDSDSTPTFSAKNADDQVSGDCDQDTLKCTLTYSASPKNFAAITVTDDNAA